MSKKSIVIVTMVSVILGSGYVLADRDEYEYDKQGKNRLDVAPVTNALYSEECGSCHFTYQPGLLPARSWKRMMETLDDHFGENAELADEDNAALLEYLTANSADNSEYKRSRSILKSIKASDTPLRITETRYFVRKHDEVPKRMVKGNPDVRSFSNCNACHTKADTGSYDEHQVKIPGYGTWDD